MASIYKRGCDKKLRNPPWYFSFIDESGVRRQRKGFTDKTATERLALKLEEEAKMIRQGLKEKPIDETARSVEFQLTEYIKHLKQRDVSESQTANVELRLRKVVDACRFSKIDQILAQPVEDYLAKRRKDGLGKQTSNHYRQAINQFCKWLAKRGLIKNNPIAEIPKLNVETDRRHERRALSNDEFQRLIWAAESGSPIEAIAGIDRAMLYVLSAWTGFRRGELSSLTLASFLLEADPPRVIVDAKYSKRRKRDTQVLHSDVVERLREWLKIRVSKHASLLFPLTKPTCGVDRKTSKMMELDLGVAREAWIKEAPDEEERKKRIASDYLKYKNSAGVFADFHANRHTFITNLAKAGVQPKVAQTLARHSDIRLTMDVYTHTELDEKAAAVAMLPRMAKSELPRVKEKQESPLQKLRRENKEAAAARKKANQRSSSVSGSPDGRLGHPTAEPSFPSIGQTQESECIKSLSLQDLSRDGTECQRHSEVHPPGFEPGTFGSVDRCSIQLSYGCESFCVME